VFAIPKAIHKLSTRALNRVEPGDNSLASATAQDLYIKNDNGK
jgi:hypothetical protein